MNLAGKYVCLLGTLMAWLHETWGGGGCVERILFSIDCSCLQPYGHATKKKPCPLSPGLLVHMHGGGYVSQTPNSHKARTSLSIV